MRYWPVGRRWEGSEFGDVMSFGIVILELFEDVSFSFIDNLGSVPPIRPEARFHSYPEGHCEQYTSAERNGTYFRMNLCVIFL